jgi:hypothetical protein
MSIQSSFSDWKKFACGDFFETPHIFRRQKRGFCRLLATWLAPEQQLHRPGLRRRDVHPSLLAAAPASCSDRRPM